MRTGMNTEQLDWKVSYQFSGDVRVRSVQVKAASGELAAKWVSDLFDGEASVVHVYRYFPNQPFDRFHELFA